MKIKLESIDQEITLQQAKDVYEELKELLEPRTNFSPPFFPNLPWIEPYIAPDPMRITYGPGTTEWHTMSYDGVDK